MKLQPEAHRAQVDERPANEKHNVLEVSLLHIPMDRQAGR